MSNGNLKNLLTDIADAIRTKEGSSDPINPQDFSTRIANLSGGSGGSELEGEYFLAKPNGRYWKFTFMPEGYHLRIEDFNRDQIDAMLRLYDFLLNCLCVWGAATSCDDAGGWETLVQADGFYNIVSRMSDAYHALQLYLNGYNYDPVAFNEGFLIVWRECNVKANPPIEYNDIPMNDCGLIEIAKMAARFEGMEITDEEAILVIEQIFMVIPATEEEYKHWRFEDED